MFRKKKRELVKHPHKALTRQCIEVPHGVDVTELAHDMREIMAKNNVLCLAANQVGEKLRVLVVNCEGWNRVLVNPILVKSYGGLSSAIESSRSYPGKQAKMVRPKQIIVACHSVRWKPLHYKLKGLVARAVLHGLDQLNGESPSVRLEKAQDALRGEAGEELLRNE